MSAIKRSILLSLALTMALGATAEATTTTEFSAYASNLGQTGWVRNIEEMDRVDYSHSPLDVSVKIWAKDQQSRHTIIWPLGTPDGWEGKLNDSYVWFMQYPFAPVNYAHASGVWTPNGSLWDFTATVRGSDATPFDSNTRVWLPKEGMYVPGMFTDYTYTLTGKNMTRKLQNDWLINDSDPETIAGTFDGTFVVTTVNEDLGILYGDRYRVHLDFATRAGVYSEARFGNLVPEPLTMASAILAIGGLGSYLRKRTRVA